MVGMGGRGDGFRPLAAVQMLRHRPGTVEVPLLPKPCYDIGTDKFEYPSLR